MQWRPAHKVKKLDAATKAKVEDIQATLGHYSTNFLAACLAAYSGDEIALMTDLLAGALPLQLKKLYLRIGGLSLLPSGTLSCPPTHACWWTCTRQSMAHHC